MRIKCFLCENILPSVDQYMVHLKEHVIPKKTLYECTFLGCFQKFNIKYSFKKHLLMHFKNCNEKSKVVENCCEEDRCFQSSFNSTLNSNDINSKIIASNFDSQYFNYQTNLDKIYDLATQFITKLHGFSNFSRSDVNNIRIFVENLLLNPLLNFIEGCQNGNNLHSNVIGDLKNIFKNVKSDFILQKTLKEKGLIGNVENVCINNNAKSSAVLMPLEAQFKSTFEKKYNLCEVLEYMKSLEQSDNFINFIQGDLWKQKKMLYPNEIMIPYFLYVDDFGINNPLGAKSNRHAMCNFYYSFPSVSEKSSKLNTVFLAYSIKSSEVKQHGNCSFEPLIQILKKLEIEGIDIKTEKGIINVKFIMGLLLGDNLGLNTALGFSKSFSSLHYCRFCLVKKTEAQKDFSENKHFLRNRINYNESIERDLLMENGISSKCIFNNIPSFHCTENFSVDIMHDLFEGVCHHILCESLLYFIKKMKFLSIDVLNSRLKSFQYDSHDHGNEKFSITLSELENHKLKMSAKQMMAFCHHFTILIGEYINIGDPVWIFILKFFEFIDDILCYQVTDALIEQIRSKIEYINKYYQILFKRNLTPKFHFLLHYTYVMIQSGPLRNFWCFKYEAKHREFKIYSHIITSRKNIAKSFSFKQQVSFANNLLETNNEEEVTFNSQVLKLDIKKKIGNSLGIPIDEFLVYFEARIWGYNYNSKKMVATFNDDFQLFKINMLVKTTTGQIILCCSKIVTEFNVHYSAYNFYNITEQYTFLNINDTIGPPVSPITTTQGKEFLKLKEYYKSIY